MYQPKHFNESNIEIIQNIINKFDFATLIISESDNIEISHIPMFLDHNNNNCIYGHIALANPMVKIINEQSITAKAIFSGNHGYISNSYYTNPNDNVPTWNYVAIHIAGKISLITNKDEIASLLDRQFAKYETNKINWDNPKISKLLNGIYGIKIDIQKIDAKFKLSQNKSEEEQTSIINHLANSNNQDDHELAIFMKKYLKI